MSVLVATSSNCICRTTSQLCTRWRLLERACKQVIWNMQCTLCLYQKHTIEDLRVMALVHSVTLRLLCNLATISKSLPIYAIDVAQLQLHPGSIQILAMPCQQIHWHQWDHNPVRNQQSYCPASSAFKDWCADLAPNTMDFSIMRLSNAFTVRKQP